MKIANEDLFRHYLTNGINLFLGAGFSVNAIGAGKGLPAGDGLRTELIDEFKRRSTSKLSLAQLAHVIASTNREALINFLRHRFTVESFDSTYKNLEKISIRSIFTTNIDDLIYKIFSDSSRYYVNDVSLRGPVIAGGSAIDYIALHGSVAHVDDDFAFSPIEIASSFERDKDRWFGYIDRIQRVPTLYWGYRVEDAGVLQALSKDTAGNKQRADSWIVLRQEDEDAIEYYASLDFQIIVADTDKLLQYFGQLPKQAVLKGKGSLVSKNFREYAVPTLASVPVRSITEFFLGAEPAWYDVYSGKLHETKHFTAARNAAVGNKHVILLGGALTGKSTLLKQLATRLEGLGTALFIDEITPEKALLVARDADAEGQRLLCVIDNVADAADAIQALVNNPNIRVIAAERDYVFDSVSHRFPRNQFTLLDVSGLDDFDIQSVENTIPGDVKRGTFDPHREDQLSADVLPTFFELMTSVTRNALASRFMEAVQEFKATKPIEHDLLLLACYLYSCRIPISVDIATAFLRPREINALEALRIMESVSSLLATYEGVLADSAQSYFVPRSRHVAETVMRNIPGDDLRRILEVFHSEVSPTRIGRYDIFRRSAYDARTIGRAFHKWEEGLDFYKRAVSRDPSFSLKQQAALYLSHMKNYELAFTWIDEARSQAGHSNPTIRNTFAVILFNANYDKLANDEVMTRLDESMAILMKCHDSDYRKLYHAKVFADQALRYRKKFPASPNAPTYLSLSEKWLSAEWRDRPGDRRLAGLLGEIRKAST